jgi:glutamyl-tRNA synthetase
MRERATFIKDFVEKCSYFFQRPAQYDPEVVKKRWTPESATQLKRLASAFEGLQNPQKEEFEAALHQTAEALKVKNGDLIHPLRLAVSGIGSGPGLYDILVILGKDESVQRINFAIGKLQ